jgi:hypothetical protein
MKVPIATRSKTIAVTPIVTAAAARNGRRGPRIATLLPRSAVGSSREAERRDNYLAEKVLNVRGTMRYERSMEKEAEIGPRCTTSTTAALGIETNRTVDRDAWDASATGATEQIDTSLNWCWERGTQMNAAERFNGYGDTFEPGTKVRCLANRRDPEATNMRG